MAHKIQKYNIIIYILLITKIIITISYKRVNNETKKFTYLTYALLFCYEIG